MSRTFSTFAKKRVTQPILPRVIGAIGAPDFAAITAGAVCEFLGFELMAVFCHRPTSAPAVVFDNFTAGDARVGIQNYIHFTHKMNPMLARALPAGVCRARDFALDPRDSRGGSSASHVVLTTDEELGFRTIGWPQRQEEISLYLEADVGLVELGFYRKRGRTVAPANKLDALQTLAAPISAAFDRHEALCRSDRQLICVTPMHSANLSPREREICDLMLLGCSTAAIALRLEISPYTVKDHRKHIFRKLKVGSLAELFALRSRNH